MSGIWQVSRRTRQDADYGRGRTPTGRHNRPWAPGRDTSTIDTEDILSLQRTVGNQAVAAFLTGKAKEKTHHKPPVDDDAEDVIEDVEQASEKPKATGQSGLAAGAALHPYRDPRRQDVRLQGRKSREAVIPLVEAALQAEQQRLQHHHAEDAEDERNNRLGFGSVEVALPGRVDPEPRCDSARLLQPEPLPCAGTEQRLGTVAECQEEQLERHRQRPHHQPNRHRRQLVGVLGRGHARGLPLVPRVAPDNQAQVHASPNRYRRPWCRRSRPLWHTR